MYKGIYSFFDLLSKIATVVVAIVAIFGYFYTVKPTYELKHLEREYKQVEEKSILLKIQNNDLNNTIVKNKQIIEQLAKIKDNNEVTIDQLHHIRQSKEKEFQNLQSNLIDIQHKKNLIEWNIFINNLRDFCKKNLIPPSDAEQALGILDKFDYSLSYKSRFPRIEYTKFDILLLNKNTPYNVVLSAIETNTSVAISENSNNNFKEFSRKYIAQHKDQLLEQISLDTYLSLKDKYNNSIRELELKRMNADNETNKKIAEINNKLKNGVVKTSEYNKLQDDRNQLFEHYNDNRVNYDSALKYQELYNQKMLELDTKTIKIVFDFIQQMNKEYLKNVSDFQRIKMNTLAN